jgi:hypothetical protein
MKKIIMLVSIALMSGCMYALAEDTGTMGNNTTPPANTMNQAGNTMDNAANTAANSANDTMSTTTDTTKSVTTTAKNMKSCVDDNGVTLKKGDAGFRACVKQHKQQSGVMGNDTDMNNNGG